MAGKARKHIETIASKIATDIMNAIKFQFNNQRQENCRIGTMSADRTIITFNDGSKFPLTVIGSPQEVTLACETAPGHYLAVGPYPKFTQIDGGDKGALILKSIEKVDDRYEYFVKYLSSSNTPVKINVQEVTNYPSDTQEIDPIQFVGFSPSGKHILVGAVITEVDNQNFPLELYWGVLKNWKITRVSEVDVLTYNLEQGFKILSKDEVELVEDPGEPGPLTLPLTYFRDHQGGIGRETVCPPLPGEHYKASLLYVKEYVEEDTVTYERADSDPILLDLMDHGAELNIFENTYVFSEILKENVGFPDTKIPSIDFISSYTSVYQRFAVYYKKYRATNSYWKVFNEQRQIFTCQTCKSDYEQRLAYTEESDFANVDYPVKNSKNNYIVDPCRAYDEEDILIDQTQGITTTSTLTSQECELTQSGNYPGCNFHGIGDCQSINGLSIACPEGPPTCIYAFGIECELAPAPNPPIFYAFPLAEPPYNIFGGCLGGTQYIWGELRNTAQGILAIENLESIPTITNYVGKEIHFDNSLILNEKAQPSCIIEMSGWVGPYTGGGTIVTHWLTKDPSQEIIGDSRYLIIPKKGFRDRISLATAALAINADNDSTPTKFSPYLTPGEPVGDASTDTDLSVVTDQLAIDQFEFTENGVDLPFKGVKAKESLVIKTYENVPPSQGAPAQPQKIKLREFKFTTVDADPFLQKSLSGNQGSSEVYTVEDWVILEIK